jgi:glycosyltransferase involved in cell wall biosynthesis
VEWLNKVVFEMHNFAEALSLRGHQVYAIDYRNRWKKNSLFDFGSLNTTESTISRAIHGSSVHLRSPGFIKIPGVSRLSAGFTQLSEIKRTIKEKNIDIIMLYSVPTNGLQVINLAKKFGIPVVFRSIDILHRLVKYPLLRFPTKLLEKQVYSKVDQILAITPNHSKYVIGMGAPGDKVKLLPLPIDTEIFHPIADVSEFYTKWELKKDGPLIVFIGTLFEFSGLDGFIGEFPEIIKQVPGARLLIVGDGPQRLKLKQLIAELHLEKQVIMTGLQPYQTMPYYINMATVCINPFLDTTATRDIFPGKIIQYLACGKATVATPLLGITSLLPQGSKEISYAGNASEMVQKIISLIKDTNLRQQTGMAGLNYVKLNHDQKVLTQQLEKDLEDLVAGSRAKNP